MLLFKPNFDFRRHARVVWVGEPSVDDRGPYRQFLLFVMIHIPALHKRFFRNESRLLFTSATKSVVEKQRIIRQLSALAILYLGRGPHCFHPSIINYMFFSQVDNDPDLVDYGDLMKNISQIESGDNSLLYASNIHPTQDQSKKVLR